MADNKDRVWLILGAASGFGRAMAEHVLDSGEKAVVADRVVGGLEQLVSTYPADRIQAVAMDITNADQVAAAFATAKLHFGRLDVMFNSAGVGLVGEVEAVPDAKARWMMDINFWGAERVTRHAVRFFREENGDRPGGTIAHITSLGGIKSLPADGHYCAAKFALEGLCEAVAMELDPAWNIKVALIEPGWFLTGLSTNDSGVKPHPAYTNPSLPSVQLRTSTSRTADEMKETYADPRKGVRAMYDVINLGRPFVRLPLGPGVVEGVQWKIDQLTKTLEEFKSCSDNLQFDP
ncbi:NAD(P)-binding protein [Coniophora puteana RWD-64-598 SS2]|uniref:NAD(P)-binding protein n=1 Tax=Coniophora puteana (strain RWD-64-598) TaxID=741705 RepID=A0A5M3MRI7_CONPW|nr:NAD(P)-binding protein [Coniophora puteana RWD-64-598 SS2]EIW81161.1 NAD(P)-binding protein [Coniophora puteana RWD-64-598 SS2]